MKSIMAAFAALLLLSLPAQAKHHRHRNHYKPVQTVSECQNGAMCFTGVERTTGHLRNSPRASRKISYRTEGLTYEGHIVSHPAGCPRVAFCGCGVSVRVFGHPVRSLFLASNWFRFPRASPGPGMVAVRNHHVMYIQSVDANGNAVVYDPNSGGHQTRIHTRSLSGYRVVNPGSRIAALE